MPRKPAAFEESKHYNGQATAKFYPGAHYYKVDDEYTNEDGKLITHKGQRMGGGTSLTGVMAKGPGLMLYPMYEMRKFLKQWARTNTLEDILSSPYSFEDILKEGTLAHTRKSDRGKSVGTDAHAWVELTLREMLRVQEVKANFEQALQSGNIGQDERTDFESDSQFVYPDIPEVEEIAVILRRSYIEVFKALKPANVDDYMKLPKLLFQDAEIQQALWTEASMLHRSTTAAKAWFELHGIYVHGTEDTVYSRKLQVCGKYDADISVTCSEKCNWCYLNGDEQKVIDVLNEFGKDHKFTGRYIADFKSTNASTSAPKGIYPEYLAQCGVYDVAKTEEFPEIVYDGHLILNGSKNKITNEDGSPMLNPKTKQPLQPFNTHFSFERERNCAWAITLADVKEFIYDSTKEVEGSA
jgi:hypothetical protein